MQAVSFNGTYPDKLDYVTVNGKRFVPVTDLKELVGELELLGKPSNAANVFKPRDWVAGRSEGLNVAVGRLKGLEKSIEGGKG